MIYRSWHASLLAACLLPACFSFLTPASCTEADESHDEYYGRYHVMHTVRRCCTGLDCLEEDQGRYAFVTSVRTPEYILGLRELHCSLQKSNPNVTLITISSEGDLEPHQIEEIKRFGQHRFVEDIKQENRRFDRFGKNWMKLRVWAWDEFDAIILLDSDMVVLEDITHLFRLPTDFAFAPQQGHSGWYVNSGGFILLRPCRAVFQSMMVLMQSDEKLKFMDDFAEQSFLTWFFRYTAFELPMRYNLNFKFLLNGLAPGGEPPAVIHFAQKEPKPFHAGPGDPEFEWFCWKPQHT